jgi:hypothetical protein
MPKPAGETPTLPGRSQACAAQQEAAVYKSPVFLSADWRPPLLEARSADPFWVAHASRVLAKPSRVRELSEDCFGETPKPTRETRALPRQKPLAFDIRHSTFDIRNSEFGIRNSSGGIAQLVERQLCKLDVRGSNPLASKACKAWRQCPKKEGALLDALAGA